MGGSKYDIDAEALQPAALNDVFHEDGECGTRIVRVLQGSIGAERRTTLEARLQVVPTDRRSQTGRS